MLWLALALPFTALEVTAKPQIPLGVSPKLAAHYVPMKSDPSLWKCLDGSKQIAWGSVNDDYCDCPDGSDEPGTSACANSTFFCQNEGHLGASIPSSRVNDGLCEPECCDGSDETSGVCPNLCKEIGDVHRKQQEADRKLRKTGSKIRASYITFAQKEKKRLEAVIAESAQEIVVREKEVERLKELAERTESLSAAALERKKRSPFYLSLLDHSFALKSLQREHQKALERSKALEEILSSLRSGYNPNYQDMAVLEAVRGWEYHAGLPHIGTEENEEGGAPIVEKEEEKKAEAKSEEPELEDGWWSKEELEGELDTLINTDYVGLLLEHDEYTDKEDDESLLFDISSYIPDSLIPKFETMRETFVDLLKSVGFVREHEVGKAAESSHARKAFEGAERSLENSKKEKQQAQEQYEKLFDVDGFGMEGEWKKLDGLCLDKDVGDYNYEVCLFGEAKQKPNKGGSTFSLGHFASWDNKSPDVKPGDPAYYNKQYYQNGARCWNGPARSVNLVLSCGTENAIHSVVELEKCEYQFTGTSPALCLPPDEEPGVATGSKTGVSAGKEEL